MFLLLCLPLNEYKFYQILKELEDKYIIIPQLNLAAIVRKINNNKYYSELFRNIDFAIFSKDYKKLLLLIEINDQTHKNHKRKDRDLKVKKICNDYDMPSKYEVIKEWYNGYLFGKVNVYNPWSVMQYVDDLVANINFIEFSIPNKEVKYIFKNKILN